MPTDEEEDFRQENIYTPQPIDLCNNKRTLPTTFIDVLYAQDSVSVLYMGIFSASKTLWFWMRGLVRGWHCHCLSYRSSQSIFTYLAFALTFHCHCLIVNALWLYGVTRHSLHPYNASTIPSIVRETKQIFALHDFPVWESLPPTVAFHPHI